MMENTKSIRDLILNELSTLDVKVERNSDIKKSLEDKFGKPIVINSSIIETEFVFDIKSKKISLIEASSGDITGYSVYEGKVPDYFVQKMPSNCANPFTRTNTVTTTSPVIRVSILTWLFGGGPMTTALAIANFIAHSE